MPAEGPLRDGNTADFDLIETMRWEPAAGFVRFDRHLARLYRLGGRTGFACDPRARRRGAAEHCRPSRQPAAHTLSCSPQWQGRRSAQPYEPLPPTRSGRCDWRRCGFTQATRCCATRRAGATPTAGARRISDTEADEVILLNERGELCEGTITNLFADFGDGAAADTGARLRLAAGVLRGELLDEGRAREACSA